MLLSMTGYGRKVIEFGNRVITIELRALNNKFLDLNVRIPQEFREHEMSLRKSLQQNLIRGKVDLTINIDNLSGDEEHELNVDAINRYMDQYQSFASEKGLSTEDAIKLIMALPQVTKPRKAGDGEEEWRLVSEGVEFCAGELMKFREREGAHTLEDLRLRVDAIEANSKDIEASAESRSERIRKRIESHMADAVSPENIDSNRLEQEMIYYLEKLDITEEIVRLASHLKYFREILEAESMEKGKKMGFVAQEIGREINTIGSKANDAQIQQSVVKMKDDLEKIKEQALNIV